MPPEVQNGAAEMDPMSTAASGLEAPKFPVLAPDKVCRFKITSAKIKATKETQSLAEDDPNRRTMLELVLSTTKDYKDTDGKDLRAGFKVFHYIMTSPWPDHTNDQGKQVRERTMKNIAEDLGMVLKACGKGSTTPRELLNNPSLLENEIVDCKVGVRKGEGTYNDSNTIKFVLPA